MTPVPQSAQTAPTAGSGLTQETPVSNVVTSNTTPPTSHKGGFFHSKSQNAVRRC